MRSGAGDRTVRFWDPSWQKIIHGSPEGYLERIIQQGFDGVYLDRSDVYEELLPIRKTAARDMVGFIKDIGRSARKLDPRFLIIMQNAEDLLDHGDLRQSIDAVAKEDLLFGLDFSQKQNARESVDASTRQLNRMRRSGRPVLAIEYVDDPEKIAAARRRHSTLGYLVYFAPRNLDEIVPDPIARGPYVVRRPVGETAPSLPAASAIPPPPAGASTPN